MRSKVANSTSQGVRAEAESESETDDLPIESVGVPIGYGNQLPPGYAGTPMPMNMYGVSYEVQPGQVLSVEPKEELEGANDTAVAMIHPSYKDGDDGTEL